VGIFLDARDSIPPAADAVLVLKDVLKRVPPPNILKNKDLVVELVLYHGRVYQSIPDKHELKKDRDVVAALLSRSPFRLTRIPPLVQQQHADLVGKALAQFPLTWEPLCNHCWTRLDAGLWTNRSVVLGWFLAGGYLHDLIPQELQRESREDEELFLAIPRQAIVFLEPHISVALRKKKSFIIKAVEPFPWLLGKVADELVGDLDVMVAALAGENGQCLYYAQDFTRRWFSNMPKNDRIPRSTQLWFDVAKHVWKKLQAHDAFVKLILCTTQSPGLATNDHQSPLHILNQGKPTALIGYLKPIAQFVGLPIGSELGRLRRARKALAQMGYWWPDPKI